MIQRGAHFLLDRKGRKVPGLKADKLVLAHYPVRSAVQIVNKVYTGWLTRLSAYGREYIDSYNIEKLFNKFLRDGMPECEELTSLAVDYNVRKGKNPSGLAYDPLPEDLAGFELRYTSVSDFEPIATTLRVAEEIAAELGSINRGNEGLVLVHKENILKLSERHLRKKYLNPLLKLLGVKS